MQNFSLWGNGLAGLSRTREKQLNQCTPFFWYMYRPITRQLYSVIVSIRNIKISVTIRSVQSFAVYETVKCGDAVAVASWSSPDSVDVISLSFARASWVCCRTRTWFLSKFVSKSQKIVTYFLPRFTVNYFSYPKPLVYDMSVQVRNKFYFYIYYK